MSYATIANVQSEFRVIVFTGPSAVTEQEVLEFLAQADATIDMFLAQRYQLPITDPDSLLVLKKIAIDFAAYRIAKIINLKKEIPLPDRTVVQDLNNGAAFRQSIKLLDLIFKGDVLLPGATPLSEASGFSDYNSNNAIEPIFQRDTKQW